MVTGHAPSSKPSATETFYELAIRTTFDETTTLHFYFFLSLVTPSPGMLTVIQKLYP